MTSNDDLRARLAFLEQELKNKIARVTQTASTKASTLMGAARNVEHSGDSFVDRKKSVHNLLVEKDLSESTRKNFKWTAPDQNKNTNSVAMKSQTSPVTSNSHTLERNQAAHPVAFITETTLANSVKNGSNGSSNWTNSSNGSKNGASPAQATPNVTLLLAKIRMINEEASIMCKNFSINTNSSSLDNMKSPLNDTPIMKKGKKRKSEVKASRLLHKWTNSSAKSATKAVNRRKSPLPKALLDDKGLRESTNNGKKKKSWKKQDGDFIFVPIATHQYCMFFNKLGSCRSGSNCVFKHDPSKVTVCRRYLQGRCSDVSCPLSHISDPDKMPDCEYFEVGSCSKDDCAYRHVKFSSDTKRCDDFLNGFCPMGRSCKNRHLFKSSAFETKLKSKEKNIVKYDFSKDTLKRRVGEGDDSKAGTISVVTTVEEYQPKMDSAGGTKSQIFDDEIPLDMTETDLFIPLPDFEDLMGVDSGPDSDSEAVCRDRGRGASRDRGGDGDEGAEVESGKDGDFHGANDKNITADREDLDVEDHSETKSVSDNCSMDVHDDEVNASNSERDIGEEERSVKHKKGTSPTSVAISSKEGNSCDREGLEHENYRIIAELKAAKILDLLPTSFLCGSEPDPKY